jgi:hypothetical protein
MKNLDRWSAADIPDLTGKRAIVTGATSGLGLVMATELAAHGAAVTLAARNATKAETAKELILAAHPKARLDVALVDVASLKSVRAFATTWLATNKKLDILVNNAGVMAVPKRQLTEDGFELQFNEPIDRNLASDPGNWDVQAWNYTWSHKYGSDLYSIKDPTRTTGKKGELKGDVLAIKAVEVTKDGKNAFIRTAEPPTPAMQLMVRAKLSNAAGVALPLEYYGTVNAVPH